MASEKMFELDASRILFEDDDLIAVDKPAGLPSQATLDPRRPHLARAIEAYLQARGSAAVYVGQHHRLDLDTTGVIVFTKSKRANSGLAEQFKERRAEKTYSALVTASTQIKSEWSVRNHLAPEGKGRMHSVRSGGERAETRFELRARQGGFAWVEAHPKTGRRHQIRVHLAEAGYPILGDPTYGGSLRDAKRTMLHARELKITHPISGAPLIITAPLPQDFAGLARRLGLLT